MKKRICLSMTSECLAGFASYALQCAMSGTWSLWAAGRKR
jgi:hypothetical protein